MKKIVKKLKEELQAIEKELEAGASVSPEEDFQDSRFDMLLKNFLKETAGTMDEYEIELIEKVLPPARISEKLFKKLMKTVRAALQR